MRVTLPSDSSTSICDSIEIKIFTAKNLTGDVVNPGNLTWISKDLRFKPSEKGGENCFIAFAKEKEYIEWITELKNERILYEEDRFFKFTFHI